jgi:hypothetical protein
VDSAEEILGLLGAGGDLAKKLLPHGAGEAQDLQARLVELLKSCKCFVDVGHGGLLR